jgi:hypothetical protein
MPRYLKVIIIIVATLVILWLGITLIDYFKGGSLNLSGKPTTTPWRPTVTPTQVGMETPYFTTMVPFATMVVRDLPPIDMGMPCTDQGVAVTVLGATLEETVGGFSPAVGNVYMVVDVQIENTSLDEYEYRFVYLGFMDANGQTYFPPHPSPVVAPPPTIDTGSLTKGESVRGNILLEIPSGQTTGTFRYSIETVTIQTWCQFRWIN